MGTKIIRKHSKHFTDVERRSIIEEYLSTGCSKQEIWQKYTIHNDERGHFLRWMRELGYPTKYRKRSVNIEFHTDVSAMSKQDNPDEKSFETLQLEKRIAQLENQLKEAELKAIAYATMVDLAEKEYKLPIRKKFSTKP
jgi:transposase